MEKKKAPKTKWLAMLMSEEEHKALENIFHQSTCSTMSDYMRKMVLGKPIVLHYRDRNLDEFMTRVRELQKELNSIGGNFNQLVRRLHALKNLPDLQQWILLNEQEKTRLFRQIEAITNTVNQIYQRWSRD
jgi:hypothetical protein